MVCQSSGPETGNSQQFTNMSTTSSESVPSVAVAVNSHGAAAVSPHKTGGSCSDTEALNELMANLNENMTRQGVSTESKGLCAACSKPIIGQVCWLLLHPYLNASPSRVRILMEIFIWIVFLLVFVLRIFYQYFITVAWVVLSKSVSLDIYIRCQNHEDVSVVLGGQEQVRLQCLLEGALRQVRWP